MAEFLKEAEQHKIDLAAVQEPPTSRGRVTGTESHHRVFACRAESLLNAPESAIVIINPQIVATGRPDLTNRYLAVVNMELVGFSFNVIGLYAKFSVPTDEIIGMLEQAIRKLRGNIVIMGDFNAHSTIWGSARTDNRGQLFEDFIARHGFNIVNNPASPPTFINQRGSSHIDVTLCTSLLADKLMNWEVKDWTSSDHRVVYFEMESASHKSSYTRQRLATRNADWKALQENLKWHLPGNEEDCNVDQTAKTLTIAVQNACAEMLPILKTHKKGVAVGLRLTEVRIDRHTVRGNVSRLECKFDLQGESLYSVKWYKDGHEFYRYLPKDRPPAQLFPREGVNVKLSESNESQVTIGPLELSSSGRYRCEVSAEAPSFQTVSDHGDMVTVALPEEGPRIFGGKPRYQLGEKVKVNCTSGPSKPAAQLTWYINGEPARESYLRGPYLREEGEVEGLIRTTLGLDFRVERRHFKRGDLKLKCLASIGTVYWNSNEESVEGERPQRPPALEIKDQKPHSSGGRISPSSGYGKFFFSSTQFLVVLSVLLSSR